MAPLRAVSAVADSEPRSRSERFATVCLEEFGELAPIGRPGGQGRVYRPLRIPATLAAAPVVVKLYRRPPSAAAADVLAEMISWSRTLDAGQRARLHRVTAWPLTILTTSGKPVGIAMYDVSGRFEVPFVMPSGRQQRVLLSLEHLLGSDRYLQLRGLHVRLDTTTRTEVAERISGGLAFLHRHGIVASDIAPNNLLVGFSAGEPAICFIDCDSMVFHGHAALEQVETIDWQMPAAFSEPPRTRAADAYKLGLVVLRLFARTHDARQLAPHVRHVPPELRDLIARSLSPAAANRPPAGEWQRALRQLLVQGGLDERYPGPTPSPTRAGVAVPSTWRPGGASQPTARATGSVARSGGRQGRGRQPVSLAWLVIAAVVLAFMLAQLLAATAPSLGGVASGQSGRGQANVPNQNYYAPSGQGFGNGFP